MLARSARPDLLRLVLFSAALALPADGVQFTVTTTHDDGAGSLRQAVRDANTNGTEDTIVFALGAGVHTITLTGATVTLTEGLTISGTSEFSNRVIVSGDNNGSVFRVDGAGVCATFENLTVRDGSGGGITAGDGTSVRLANCSVRDNSAFGGGGLRAFGANVRAENTTFTGNAATSGSGGAIESAGPNASLTLLNCTISGNSATLHAGGIRIVAGGGSMINCTVTDNTADSDQNDQGFAGGILDTVGQFVIQNSIVAGNHDLSFPGVVSEDLVSFATFINLGNNLIGNPIESGSVEVFFDGVNGDHVGTSASPLDPQLGPLQNHGGIGLTHLPAFGSPAVDGGLSSAITDPPFTGPNFTDGRLAERIVGGSVDIGAVEADFVFTVENTDNAGLGSLRRAIEDASAAGSGVIAFDPAVFGDAPQTITLTGGQIVLAGSLTINGPFPHRVTIDANNVGRLFDITSSGTDKITIDNLRFVNGDRTNGGAIRVIGADTVVCGDNLVFEDNEANSDTGAGGGALTIDDATVTLSDSAFVGNHSANDGGAIAIQNNADLTLTNVTVSGNTADGSGGGIANNGGALVLTNVTVTDNTAAQSNTLVGIGGGVSSSSGTSVQAWNTIIAGNRSNGADPDIAGPGFSSLGHNLVGEAIPGSGFTNGINDDQVGFVGFPVDPMLDPIADNGGDTLTHHLQTGGPAVNAGDNAALLSPPFDDPGRDQRGQYRIYNNNVDIGAYERTLVTVVKIQGEDRSFAEGIPGTRPVVFERALTEGSLDIEFELDASGTTNAQDFALGGSGLTNLGGGRFRLTFEDGSALATVLIDPDSDNNPEDDETIVFNLLNVIAYSINPAAENGNSVVVTIIDDDSPAGPLTYQQHADEVFPPGTPPAQKHPAFDFDLDGLANGIEFIMGRNLLGPDEFGRISLSINGPNFLIEFPRRNEIDPATAAVEHSTDLGRTDPWSRAGVTYQVVGPLTPTVDRVRARIPRNGERVLFGRLVFDP